MSKLPANLLEQYRDEGYIGAVDVMSPESALKIRQQLEAFEATQGGALHANQRSRAFLLFKWLDELIHSSAVLDPVESLIGPNIMCWSSIFWIKEAGSKSFVDWHQDNTYWGLSSRRVVTAWFAISDASEQAGCMSVIPRTHVGTTLEHEDTYDENNMLTRGQRIVNLDTAKAVSMPLRAGQMSLHNYCLAHGSGPNRSDDRRIGVSMHFMPPDTQQQVVEWDCGALVRGEDTHGHFAHTPRPQFDMDPECVAFHAKASGAMRDVLYAGAKEKLGRL
jgi:non-heme Fe2+,alpha-ketoglutarate-dependent halogenase